MTSERESYLEELLLRINNSAALSTLEAAGVPGVTQPYYPRLVYWLPTSLTRPGSVVVSSYLL